MKTGIIMLMAVVALLILGSVPVNAQSTASGTPYVDVTLNNQNPDPAKAGDTTRLSFTIANSGDGIAENPQIELLQDYPFTVVDGYAVKNLSNLYPFQSGEDQLSVNYNVRIDKDATHSSYPLRVRYVYNGIDWITVTFNVNVVNNQFAQIIYVDKAKLTPGQETPLTFTITNVGSAPLQNLVFSWKEAQGEVLPVYSGNTKYIKYLDIGQSVNLEYTVIADVNAVPGLYQLDLSLGYQSSTNSSTVGIINTQAGVLIGGGTDFDVAFSENTAGQTSLSISNVGSNPASSVSVQIPQQDAFRVTGSNSVIIGNLDKGDYTLASFQIAQATAFNITPTGTATTTGIGGRPQASAAQQPSSQTQQLQRTRNQTNSQLLVLIDYTDTNGQRQEVQKYVPVQLRSAASSTTGTSGTTTATTAQFTRRSSSGLPKWLIYSAVAAVVIGGFFWYRGRKKKQKLLIKGKMISK